MSKFIVDLWLDGYDDENERAEAEKEFIYDQLNMTASSVKISEFEPALENAQSSLAVEALDLLYKYVLAVNDKLRDDFPMKYAKEALAKIAAGDSE